jgi:hypothetical protein
MKLCREKELRGQEKKIYLTNIKNNKVEDEILTENTERSR